MRGQKVPNFIFLFLFCVLGFKSFSQFGVSVTQGCAPLNVFFTGDAGATNPYWDFGPGAGTSFSNTPSNIYSPGVYLVTYTALVGGNPVNHTVQITSFAKPTGSFSYVLPASHCAPMTVTFAGTGGGAGAAYSWAFGDGTGGSGANTTHVYTFSHSSNPTMFITDVNGCTSESITAGGVINTSTPPIPVISANPGLSACTAPFITAFNGTGSSSGSPLTNALTYNWNFGNGSPGSTQGNTGNISYAQGQFVVTLTATDDNNCSATASTQVSVTQPSISVTVPPRVCIGMPFNVTVQSTQLSSFWNMGDNSAAFFNGTIPNAPNTGTIHIYSTPGPKNIYITVTSGACTATTSTSTFVEQVVASFTATPPSIVCSPTINASYINQTTVNTTSSLSYSWTASWGPSLYNHATFNSSTLQNPTFTFYQNSLNPYTIYQIFQPSIKLFVTSAIGCTATVTHVFDSIVRPVAFFNKNKKEGCTNLAVTYRDTSFNTTLFPITSYTWNNGANPPVTFSGVLTPPNPIPPHTFVYATAGTYTPFLTIQTAGGCTDVSFIDTVTVVDPPTVSATFPTSVCAGQPLAIHLTASPTQTAIDHWHADTDAGFFSGCITDADPSFIFTHVGVHGVTLSAYQKGCKGTSVASQSITVKGPIAKARFETDCANRKVVKFNSILQEVQTATLVFGDNTSTVIAGNPTGTLSSSLSHTYAATGVYIATLTSENPSNPCAAFVYTMQIKVRDAQANISVNGQPNFPVLPAALACTKTDITFNGSPSIDELVGCKRGYTWFFTTPATGTGTPTKLPPLDSELPSIVKRFRAPGIYTITLGVKDENGCTDTTTRRFRVSSANPAFNFSVNPICLSDNPVRMINTTTVTPLNPDPNVSFKWIYGDNSAPFTTTMVTYTASHSYSPVNPPSANFLVSLVSTNTFACTDTVSKYVTINNPSATFSTSPYFVCLPGARTFSAAPAPNTTYSISYSDSLSYSTGSNFFRHNYTTPGLHTVTLTVTDAAGCVNSSTVNITALVTPVASFTTLGSGNFCAPAQITFTSTSSTTDPVFSGIEHYTWDLGSGPLPIDTPTALNLYSAGTHTISLAVSPASGLCASSTSSVIYVYDTKAHLSVNKRKFCIGDTIIVSLQNAQDVSSWICNVGFGIQPSVIPVAPTQSLSYIYLSPLQTGTANVVATLNSPRNACIHSADSTIKIEVIKLNPDFKRNLELSVIDTVHCLKVQDQFTHGLNTVAPVTYNWDFGNGNTTTAMDPVYTYTSAGVFPVTLTVKQEAVGCVATSVKNITINPLPTVTISAGDNCPDKPFVISGEGSPGIISGTWVPAQNIIGSPDFTSTAVTAFSISASAPFSTVFALTVTDASGCVSEAATKSVTIQQPPVAFNRDTTVIIGELVPINIYEGEGFTYTWTPVTTDLNCTSCFDPTSTTTVNITYTVLVSDRLGCSEVASTYTILIDPKTSVDVPTAFTPNGDGVNDIIYVDGWGIKKLNYFKIYNRWGQLIFESSDLQHGWDGFFNGIPQNMETYVYQVSVGTYVDSTPILKTGTIKLIR